MKKIIKYFLLSILIIMCIIGIYIGIYLIQNILDFSKNSTCSKNNVITTTQFQEKFKWREFMWSMKYHNVGLPGHNIYIFLDKNLSNNKIIVAYKEIELQPSMQEQTIIILNNTVVDTINCADLEKSIVLHFTPEKVEVINYIDKERIYFNKFYKNK